MSAAAALLSRARSWLRSRVAINKPYSEPLPRWCLVITGRTEWKRERNRFLFIALCPRPVPEGQVVQGWRVWRLELRWPTVRAYHR